ncbi:Hypothetical protein BIBO2_2645 [Brucella sp. BO2]|nr:Hypothetical protein BIBO2_2645 [Brucella sp. BO2]
MKVQMHPDGCGAIYLLANCFLSVFVPLHRNLSNTRPMPLP